jgi:hypothetical protein
MDRFIYGEFRNGNVFIKKLSANSENDAKERIIRQYWDRFDDLEYDDWENFLYELADKHDIFLSDELYDVESL